MRFKLVLHGRPFLIFGLLENQIERFPVSGPETYAIRSQSAPGKVALESRSSKALFLTPPRVRPHFAQCPESDNDRKIHIPPATRNTVGFHTTHRKYHIPWS